MKMAARLCLLAAAATVACGQRQPQPRMSASGSTPVNIVQCPAGQDCLVPDMVVDSASGAWHLVYGTPDKQAYYQRSTDSGKTWTRRAKLNTAVGLNVTTTMGERGPKISQSPADGSLHVAWLDFWYPGAHTHATYLRSTDGGDSWSTPAPVSNDTGVDGVTVVATATGPVVLYHVVNGTTPANSTSSTWLYQVMSTDGGSTWSAPAQVLIDGGAQPPVACSMCMVRARVDPASGNLLIAFRSAIDNIRDFYVLNGSATGNSYTSMRAPARPWYISSCPMNGPELSMDPQGRAVLAYMTADENNVYWAVHDPATSTPAQPFSGPFPTPAQEGNERYATAVSSGTAGGAGGGDVLLVWQVGPMAVSGTATVKYGVYGLDGRYTGVGGTIGTSFAGTKATAFLGADGQFYILTTATSGSGSACGS